MYDIILLDGVINVGKINSKDYVVLDVETNGLSSLKHDLLSISIYKPDDNKTYDRFLPLELNSFVETYWINGIDEDNVIR